MGDDLLFYEPKRGKHDKELPGQIMKRQKNEIKQLRATVQAADQMLLERENEIRKLESRVDNYKSLVLSLFFVVSMLIFMMALNF
jgi:hypothetical protein